MLKNKIKKIFKKEYVGSAGIALAFYFGALAVNHEAAAEKASIAADQFHQESNVAGESGVMGSALSADQAEDKARRTEHQERDKAGVFGVLGLVALGGGIELYKRQLNEDSKKGVSRRTQERNEVTFAPESIHMDDSTRQFDISVLPPVPPVLQKR